MPYRVYFLCGVNTIKSSYCARCELFTRLETRSTGNRNSLLGVLNWQRNSCYDIFCVTTFRLNYCYVASDLRHDLCLCSFLTYVKQMAVLLALRLTWQIISYDELSAVTRLKYSFFVAFLVWLVLGSLKRNK